MARKVNGRERTIGMDIWDVLTESDDLSGTRTHEKLLIAVGTTACPKCGCWLPAGDGSEATNHVSGCDGQ